MPTTEELRPSDADTDATSGPSTPSGELKELLERAYGVQFTILDGRSGGVVHAEPSQPLRDWGLRAELCGQVARRGQPEFIEDEDPLLTLALPLLDAAGSSLVAVTTFLTRSVGPTETLTGPAELLGMRAEDLVAWARRQTPWPPEALKRISDLVLDHAQASQRLRELQREANSLSINLASTYEEISLLYRLTQNLKLSKSDEDLGRVALEWMKEVVPAAGLVMQLLPLHGGDKSLNHDARTQPVLLTCGECPIDNAQFSNLIAHLGPNPRHQPVVINRPISERPGWPCPQIHELIVVALAEDENVFGWLAALNHVEGGEFGTVEASLLSSVAAILGIHGGNIELYGQQSELLAGIVRALTSAIDAKDPYTCGHSDRVARVAVRLAEELGCDATTLDTLYLAGLLHDIGKIGVNDAVLHKAGKLSDDEYAHIKEHVNIGHRILNDLAKLENVLPVVLHHHESWDGGGYPSRLDSERIPLPARIVAVADAFDAMSSDRPYRKGMPDETVDRILRAGAGQQWDPRVIDAFFRVREDIRRICRGDEQAAEPELVGLA
jgi:HD-GYP domain-containing protein (c-di-GMP phosphodiesterase class II)